MCVKWLVVPGDLSPQDNVFTAVSEKYLQSVIFTKNQNICIHLNTLVSSSSLSLDRLPILFSCSLT